ncbi:phosphoribosyltransferase [Streptomyces sp. NRRL F-5123]|uniref:phosphoribosyltransferase n=1 Tax=Streptomyces sp. NRRL F-5123 TaxID=1463856 RepID=UPI0004E187B4|nr:phosphoribosyltransferase [Streptomyces sp. NRRL F-5123]
MKFTGEDRPRPAADAAPWTGQWVADRLGIALHGEGLPGLLGLALRRNPKRAHLLVSNVLGKHVPQRPGTVYGHARDLGLRVRALLGGQDAARAVVVGYAETATGLGHAVADGVGPVPYLHSTRREVPGLASGGAFQEEHSHATGHLLLPEDPALLAGTGPLVLVDDEFSTGQTVLNTIRDLHARHPRGHYVVVALTDMRAPADHARLAAFAAELGARVDVLSLAAGTVTLPDGVLSDAQTLVAELTPSAPDPAAPDPAAAEPAAEVRRVGLHWPAGVPDGGRHGFLPAHRAALEAALPGMGRRLAQALPAGARRVLVLGTEELMYAPLRLAQALEAYAPGGAPAGPRAGAEGLPAGENRPDGSPGVEAYFSTTTRSPVLAVDDPGYAIRSRLVFPAHDDPTDDGSRERYAYNVAGAGFDAVVCVTDSAGDTPALHAPGGLLARLAPHTGTVLLAVVPTHAPTPAPAPAPSRPNGNHGLMSATPGPLRGPDFGSYAADEVGWLLKDLSDVRLEAPTEEREEAIQSGGAHYAESLPVEYQPSAAYQDLFRAALETSAGRIARAVGAVTELVLAERGPDAVLVSLARAGTPVGVLMRRWARQAHGLELPHYAVSIVRGRGIDPAALRWLAAHHDPADCAFVDGWTGKGAITRELADAIDAFPEFARFRPEIAVLADPGGCVSTYGTRDDFLIPSACLNSTVSGLVSRTVLRADLVGPGEFHGAKFYRELAESDVSALFLDTVTAAFGEVGDDVARDVKALRAQDRSPTWAGWAAVERISEEYGIGDVNLVKPGVGETTRVLLRRVPWKILASRGAGADLDHVRLLAEQRGVPVEETDELPYSCVGLIHPRYTRGATGTDGKAVQGL